jgi:cytochrome c-type biogenesis protein CcmH
MAVPSLAFLAAAVAMTAAVAAWLLRGARARPVAHDDAEAPADGTPAGAVVRRRSLVAMAIALPLLAVGLYAWLGEPAALTDASALDAQAAFDTLPGTAVREELASHLARHPRDGRAYVLLARVEFAEDRFAEAASAYGKALATSGKVAGDPTILCEYADALGMAQGGTLAGEPEIIIRRALAIAPAHPRALEMAGSAAFEQRDYVVAVRHWRALQAQMPPESGGARELGAAIARAELMAGAALR